MGRKHKTFRRFKVSNMGYVSGKRQQMFHAHEKKQKALASGTNAGGGRVEQNLPGTVSTSHDTRGTEDLQA